MDPAVASKLLASRNPKFLIAACLMAKARRADNPAGFVIGCDSGKIKITDKYFDQAAREIRRIEERAERSADRPVDLSQLEAMIDDARKEEASGH